MATYSINIKKIIVGILVILGLFFSGHIQATYAKPSLPGEIRSTITGETQETLDSVEFGLPGENQDTVEGTPILLKTIRFLIQIVTTVSVLAIAWWGLYYMLSYGNEEKIKTAKKIITWAIIGVVFALGSTTIVGILNSFSIGNTIENQQEWSIQNNQSNSSSQTLNTQTEVQTSGWTESGSSSSTNEETQTTN